jgi:hypothetical protein
MTATFLADAAAHGAKILAGKLLLQPLSFALPRLVPTSFREAFVKPLIRISVSFPGRVGLPCYNFLSCGFPASPFKLWASSFFFYVMWVLLHPFISWGSLFLCHIGFLAYAFTLFG